MLVPPPPGVYGRPLIELTVNDDIIPCPANVIVDPTKLDVNSVLNRLIVPPPPPGVYGRPLIELTVNDEMFPLCMIPWPANVIVDPTKLEVNSVLNRLVVPPPPPGIYG